MKGFGLPSGVVIRDVTLREGLDVPGVEKRLKPASRLRLAREIYALGIREFDIVHPGRVNRQSIWLANSLKELHGKRIVVHGAAYAHNDKFEREIDLMGMVDEIDLVMPVNSARPPHSQKEKIDCAVRGLSFLQSIGKRGGVGFANASQCDRAFLLKIVRSVVKSGAHKIILYDSVGSYDPLESYELVRDVKDAAPGTPILYHCHNDLGLAVANSLLAVYAGAHYVDASMNGLGDRAGNASLEQLATIFHLKGVKTGIDLSKLRRVSDITEKLCGVKKAINHPITGDKRIIHSHVSPKHKPDRKSFEILPKELTGR